MIDKDILNELLRKAFQDFDLLDYTYSINIRIKICEIKPDGLIRMCSYHTYEDDYIKLYNHSAVNLEGILTYKDIIFLDFYFKPSKDENIAEFNEFFLDGMIKLNYFLKPYKIKFPKRKIKLISSNNPLSSSFKFMGQEKEIIVEFSSRLKV